MTTKPKPGVYDALEHERHFTQLADELERQAMRLLVESDGARVGLATARNLADAAVKARRSAAELSRWREENEATERGFAELRTMRGGEVLPPRPRLRRKGERDDG